MRHRVDGTNLNIDTSHRKALNKFMATSFVEKGAITTTLAKAKFIQPYIERLIKRARGNNTASISFLKSALHTRSSVDTLLTKVVPAFEGRNGGYTRMVKLGFRDGDNAPLARLEWVEKVEYQKNAKKGKNKVGKDTKVEQVEKVKELKKQTKQAISEKSTKKVKSSEAKK